MRPAFAVLAVVGCVVVFAAYLLPVRSSGGPSRLTKILNNLRQIDVAKQMWAQDHHATNSTSVSPADIAPYLPKSKSNQLVSAAVDERYIINAVGVGPEAQLTRSFGKWRPGTIIRFHPATNITYRIILPTQPPPTNSHSDQ